MHLEHYDEWVKWVRISPEIALPLAIYLLPLLIVLIGIWFSLIAQALGKPGWDFVAYLLRNPWASDDAPRDLHDLMFIYDMGLRCEQCELYLEARGDFLRVLRIRPNWAEPRYHLALAYLHLRESEKAREQVEILRGLDENLATKLENELLIWRRHR